MPLRALTPQEAAFAAKNNLNPATTQIDDSNNEFVDVSPQAPPTPITSGLFARQGIKSILPMIGGRLAAAGAGALAGAAIPVAGETGVPEAIGGLVGAIGGPPAVSWVQEKALNLLAKKFPSVKAFQEASQKDVQEHPYASMTSAMLASPAGGGGIGVGNLKNALTQAGIQGGVNVGQQMIANKSVNPLNLDPTELAISGIGGLVTSRPSSAIRGIERGIGQKFNVPPAILDRIAPRIPVNAQGIQTAEQAGTTPDAAISPHLRQDYNPDFLLNTDLANLNKLGPFEKIIATMRQHGIPLTPEDLKAISLRSPDYKNAAIDLMRAKLPAVDEQAQVETKRLSDANVANQKELDRLGQRNAVQGAVENLVPPEAPAKSAAESAAAITARPTEAAAVDKEIAAWKRDNGRLTTLTKLFKTLPEDHPDRPEMIGMINDLKENLDAKKEMLIKRAGEKLLYGTSPEPATALNTLDEVVPGEENPPTPKSSAQPAPSTTSPGTVPTTPAMEKPAPANQQFVSPTAKQEGTTIQTVKPGADIPIVSRTSETGTPVTPPVATNPIPEQPGAITEQMKLFRGGQKKAVLVTSGEKMPMLQPGETVTATVAGKVIHRANELAPNLVMQLAKNNRLGGILGYGVESPPVAPTAAVSVAKPSGVPVQEVTTTPETQPAVEAAAQAIAKPGDTIKVTSPEQPLQDRLAMLKPGNTVRIGTEMYNVEKVSGKKPESRILMTNKKSGTNAAITVKDLLASITQNKAEINPGENPIKSAAPEDIEAMSRLANQRSALSRDIRSVIQEDPGYIEFAKQGGGREGDYLASLPNEQASALLEKFRQKTIERETQERGVIGDKGGMQIRINPNAKQGGFTLNPIGILHEALKPAMDKVAELGNYGKRFAKRMEEAIIRSQQYTNPYIAQIVAAEKGLTLKERGLISDYLYQLKDKGQSDVKLDPDLQTRADLIRDVYVKTGMDRNKPDAPWVKDIGPDGKEITRPFEQRPNYAYEQIKPEIWKVFKDGTDLEKIKKLTDEYAKYLVEKKGIDYEDALKQVRNRMFTPATEVGVNPEFQALRLAEGAGLPPSWRTDAFTAAKRYILKTGLDLGYHQAVELDPILAKALDLQDNGQGVKTPDVVLDEKGRPVAPELAGGKPAVNDVLRDYVGATSNEAQEFEKLDRLVKSFRIQTYTELRNVAQLPAIFTEIMKPGESRFLMKAITDAVFPNMSGGKEAALRSGSLRPIRNLNPNVATDAMDGMSRIADVMQKSSGTELLNQVQRIFTDSLGRLIAGNRLAQGDTKFFEKFGPIDWQKWDRNKLLDYAAAQMTRDVNSSYDSSDQPGFMTRGAPGFFKPSMSLARWSIGRFNRWYDNVYTPATHGNIIPLISSLAGSMLSAGAVNWLTQEIYQRKPKELTWSEYLNLGKKDTAYTIFSKASTAGFAGILSDLAFAGVQAQKGEMPYGLNSALFIAEEDVLNRIGQIFSDTRNHRATIADIPQMLLETLRDNFQIYKMLTPKPDVTGMREEKLARHIGFLPGEPTISSPNVNSPFAVSQMYKNEDIPRLKNYLQHKMQPDDYGMPSIPGPTSAIRTTPAIVDGQPSIGYYEFIRKSQGEEAAKAAFLRDLQITQQRKNTFLKAIQ